MANYIDNKNCKLYGTEYCELLNMASCENCAFGKIKTDAEAEEAKHDLDVLMSNIPEEGVAPLFTSETCLLCKGKNPEKRSLYAMTDIGHPEPERMHRNIIGIKTKCRVGSLIPVQIACCSKCRRNYFMVEYLPTFVAIIVAILALIVLSARSIHEPLSAVSELLPLGLFIVLVVLGYFLGKLLRGSLKKAKARETEFDIWNLPLMKKLKALGWQPLAADKGVSRMVFTKKRVAQGVYSAENSRGKASYSEENE
ncbi:MAG: hypothetical protein IJC67_05650 [Clostridia bacterium]|nr:hypothetical protein [Clostridia bacterium]